MHNVDALQARLPICGLGEPFIYFDSVDSTNDVALERAREGIAHGALVLADEQTRERGRAGVSDAKNMSLVAVRTEEMVAMAVMW